MGLMQEQRNPLAGLLPVFRGSAAQLIAAFEGAHQFRPPESGHQLLLRAQEFQHPIPFHAASLPVGVGQIRAIPDESLDAAVGSSADWTSRKDA